jgi:hypothetical protein
LTSGINMTDYGVTPFDMHRLTVRDVEAIQTHHNQLVKAAERERAQLEADLQGTRRRG